MIQPQPPPQQYYNPSPFDPQPPHLTQGYPQPHPSHQLLAPQPQPQSQLQQHAKVTTPPSRKRKAPGTAPMSQMSQMSPTGLGDPSSMREQGEEDAEQVAPMPAPKKSRTNTPWSPAEEQRLKVMRDAGNSWGEIAKVRPRSSDSRPAEHRALIYSRRFQIEQKEV